MTVTLVDAEFNRHSHQCSLEYPTNTTDVIYENAQQLLYEMWKADRPVRLIGISAGKAAHEEFEQMSLFADERTDKLKSWMQPWMRYAINSVKKRLSGQDFSAARDRRDSVKQRMHKKEK